MEVVKHLADGDFWAWVRRRLPPSLAGIDVGFGYGHMHCVYRAGYKRGLVLRLFDDIGDVTATISGNTVSLYHPEFFSDFEDICRAYEAAGGNQTKIVVFESVK